MKRMIRSGLLVAILAVTGTSVAPAATIPVRLTLWKDANGMCPLWCEWPQLCPCVITFDVTPNY